MKVESEVPFPGHNSCVGWRLKTWHHSKWRQGLALRADGCKNIGRGRHDNYTIWFVKKSEKFGFKNHLLPELFQFFKCHTAKWTAEINFSDNFALVKLLFMHIASIFIKMWCILGKQLGMPNLHGFRAWLFHSHYSETCKIEISL